MKPLGNLFLEEKQSMELGVQAREALRRPRDRGGRPPPWARPPASWPPRGVPDFDSKSSRLLSVQERSSRRFHSVWTPFGIPFLQNSKKGKNTETVIGPPVNRLVPKKYKRAY